MQQFGNIRSNDRRNANETVDSSNQQRMRQRRYKIPLLDRNLLTEMCSEKNINVTNFEKFDEAPRNKLLSRTVKGFSNSPEEIIAEMQFDFLKNKAQQGESFVVVGRCAETVLKGNPSLISFFVLGDMENKIERISKLHSINRSEAEAFIRRIDKKRKYYHNTHSDVKWGDSRNYDLCINSCRLGLEFIDKRLAK
mgnify:CR=1 FL=1